MNPATSFRCQTSSGMIEKNYFRSLSEQIDNQAYLACLQSSILRLFLQTMSFRLKIWRAQGLYRHLLGARQLREVTIKN
jgi:hypothetical protein